MALTLDLYGQILKYSYLMIERVDWRGAKGLELTGCQTHDLEIWLSLWIWLWLWIFKVRLWTSLISGMGEQIGIEWKGCELIGQWIFGYSNSNFEIALFRNGCSVWFEMKGIRISSILLTMYDLDFFLTHDLDLPFSTWNFENKCISGITSDITLVHG